LPGTPLSAGNEKEEATGDSRCLWPWRLDAWALHPCAVPPILRQPGKGKAPIGTDRSHAYTVRLGKAVHRLLLNVVSINSIPREKYPSSVSGIETVELVDDAKESMGGSCAESEKHLAELNTKNYEGCSAVRDPSAPVEAAARASSASTHSRRISIERNV
jgi:hypothetical protein